MMRRGAMHSIYRPNSKLNLSSKLPRLLLNFVTVSFLLGYLCKLHRRRRRRLVIVGGERAALERRQKRR